MTQEQQFEINKWNEFIFENIRGSKTQRALSLYIEKLILNDTVVILDFNHLAMLLGIQNNILASIVAHTKSFYYSFEIPKRSGGARSISAPYPVLLNAQKWIYDNILSKIKVHNNAKGFIKQSSITDNARVHLNTNYVLKMDIEEFFPSIKMNRIMSIFRNLGYTKKTSYYLSSICCLHGVLPQGAATSPCLSNIIAKRMDARITGLASRFALNYTRYADDFTLSGEVLPPKIICYIEKIVNQEGFSINKKKTNLIGINKQKIITGISISSGELKIPREKKREVRKNIYYVLKNGLFEHQKQINSFDPIYVERLLGYLFFWQSVEPENEFVRSSINKLKYYSKILDKG
jgi:retron-type reverse transcriptase